MKKRNLCPAYEGKRCSGRTTAEALDTITKALQNPGDCQYFLDHSGSELADHGQQILAQVMVEKLGLQFMVFGRNAVGYFIRFDLYEYGNTGT